uniref:LsmAD domain-containing protein n=1 Tax=Eptatretus burgeri TaxID=7764 RepID=A0A8C4Q456_EPTBU
MKTGMSGPASRKTGGRPSPGGRGRGNKPPSHCLGSRCELHVKNGRTYDGIFKTFSPQLQLVLDAVHQKQEGAEGGLGGEAILPAVIFQRTDVVTVHFPNVDLSFASRDGSTEGAKVNGEHRERELQPWQGGDGELGELESDTSNGWDATEMFRCNEEVYGVKSTYDDSLSSYTTPLQSDASEDYQRRAARASQLALEMEAGSEKGEKAEEGTEEDRHAAVIRPLNLEPSTPSPPPATRVAAAAAAAAGTGSGTRSGSNAETGVGPSVANTAGVTTSPVAGTGTVSVRSERSYRTKFGNDGSEESRERTYIHRDVKYSSQPRHMRGGMRGAPGGRGGGRGGSGGPNTSPSSSPRGSPYHPHSHNTPPPHHQVYHPTESAGSPVVNGALTPSCSAPPSRPPFPPRTHPSPSNLTPNPSRSTNRLPFSHSQPQAPPSQGRRGGGMEVPRMSPKSQRPSRPPRPPGHPSSGGRVVGVGVTGGRGTPPVGDGAHNSSTHAGTPLPAEVSPQGTARMGSWSAVVSSAPSQTSPKHTTPSAPASTTPQPSSSQHYHPSNQPAPLSHAGTQSPVYSRTAGPVESAGSVLKDEPALLPPGGEGKVPIPSQTAQAPPSVEAERSQDVRELKEFCNKFTLQSSTPKEPQLPPADPVPQPQRPSPTPPAPTAGPIAESQGEGMEGEGETVVEQVRKSTLNPNAREFNPHCKAFHPTVMNLIFVVFMPPPMKLPEASCFQVVPPSMIGFCCRDNIIMAQSRGSQPWGVCTPWGCEMEFQGV